MKTILMPAQNLLVVIGSGVLWVYLYCPQANAAAEPIQQPDLVGIAQHPFVDFTTVVPALTPDGKLLLAHSCEVEGGPLPVLVSVEKQRVVISAV